MKKLFPPQAKANVAIEALKGIKTTSEIGSQYEVHPNKVGIWKKVLLDRAPDVFKDKSSPKIKEKDELIQRLYTLVGQRDIEIDWLKKKLHIDT